MNSIGSWKHTHNRRTIRWSKSVFVNPFVNNSIDPFYYQLTTALSTRMYDLWCQLPTDDSIRIISKLKRNFFLLQKQCCPVILSDKCTNAWNSEYNKTLWVTNILKFLQYTKYICCNLIFNYSGSRISYIFTYIRIQRNYYVFKQNNT